MTHRVRYTPLSNLQREKITRFQNINLLIKIILPGCGKKKLGFRDPTVLIRIIKAHEERQELSKSENDAIASVTYIDFNETRFLKDEPELRKQVLKLRAEDKITIPELRQFSKAPRAGRRQNEATTREKAG